MLKIESILKTGQYYQPAADDIPARICYTYRLINLYVILKVFFSYSTIVDLYINYNVLYCSIYLQTL